MEPCVFQQDGGCIDVMKNSLHWEDFVAKHFPDAVIPKKKKERNRFKKEVEATLLEDPEFQAFDEAFQTEDYYASD